MEAIVTELVQRFERGGLTRRELIQGLSALVAAGAAAPATAQTPASTPALRAMGINHTSVLVTDLRRSIDFYGRLFGLKTVSEDTANKIVRLGTGSGIGSTIVSLRQQPPAGTIDHFAIGVENFDRQRVTDALKPHGVATAENIEYGFYIKDPDGAVVQIV
jgi:catechol 2,3-dioxygenase-like lactoylglutathione lyase family enzyme